MVKGHYFPKFLEKKASFFYYICVLYFPALVFTWILGYLMLTLTFLGEFIGLPQSKIEIVLSMFYITWWVFFVVLALQYISWIQISPSKPNIRFSDFSVEIQEKYKEGCFPFKVHYIFIWCILISVIHPYILSYSTPLDFLSPIVNELLSLLYFDVFLEPNDGSLLQFLWLFIHIYISFRFIVKPVSSVSFKLNSYLEEKVRSYILILIAYIILSILTLFMIIGVFGLTH